MARQHGTFGFNDFNGLEQAVMELSRRMAAIEPLSITSYEIVELLTPKENREVLMRVLKLADVWGFNRRAVVNWPGIKDPLYNATEFTTHEETVALPKIPTLQSDNPELIARIRRYTDHAISTGHNFGMVRSLLRWLHNNLSNPTQIRFVWPSVLALCRLSPGLDKLQDLISEHKVPRTIPTIPTAVKDACRVTGMVISSALLLPATDQVLLPPVTAKIMWKGLSACTESGFTYHPI